MIQILFLDVKTAMDTSWRTGTYEGVAGEEGVVLQHEQADGAVARGAVELAAAAMADVAGGVGNLPAVDEDGRVLARAHRGAVSQSQVVCWVSIAET